MQDCGLDSSCNLSCSANFATSSYSSPQFVQTYGYFSRCTTWKCRAIAIFLTVKKLHIGQGYLPSPLCWFKCRECLKADPWTLSQTSQVNLPSCVKRCWRKSDLITNFFPHTLHSLFLSLISMSLVSEFLILSFWCVLDLFSLRSRADFVPLKIIDVSTFKFQEEDNNYISTWND